MLSQANGSREWSIVLLCMIAYLLSFVDRQILALLIGPIRADLKISDTQFGLLSGLAFSLFYATMGIPIATLADRSSRPRIIAIGILVWSAATMACGLARSFAQMFLARLFLGAGEAALSPSVYSLIGDIFPRERLGRALAVYSMGSFLGSGIAFLLGGWVIAIVSAHGDFTLAGLTLAPWQLTFLLVGAPGLLLALIIAMAVREPGHINRSATPPKLGRVFAFLSEHRAIFAPHFIGFSFAAASLYGLLGWAPAYLMRSFDLSSQQAGIWLGCAAIAAGGGGNLTSGLLMDALLRRGHQDAPFLTGMIGMAGIIVPTALLPFAPGFGVSFALLTASLFFASFPMAPSTAVMQTAVPPQMRSRVSALFLFANSFIGLSLSSLLIGLINDRIYGGGGTVQALAIIVTAAAVLGTIILPLGRGSYTRRMSLEPAA